MRHLVVVWLTDHRIHSTQSAYRLVAHPKPFPLIGVCRAARWSTPLPSRQLLLIPHLPLKCECYLRTKSHWKVPPYQSRSILRLSPLLTRPRWQVLYVLRKIYFYFAVSDSFGPLRIGRFSLGDWIAIPGEKHKSDVDTAKRHFFVLDN